MIKRTIRNEPLIGFFVAGAAIFVVDRGVNPPETEPHRIQVSKATVATILARETRRRGGRMPDHRTLERLVRQHVDEEILARHGAAIGLADGDPIIRRRIAQKVQLAAEADIEEPTDAELQDFLRGHADQYRKEERWRLSIRSYGPGVEGRARALRATQTRDLRVGARPLAFGDRLGWRAASELERLLGDPVVELLRQKDCTDWCGPVSSRHGQILLRVDGHRPARLPPFAELRARLRERYLNKARLTARAARVDELRDRYDVEIDWPRDFRLRLAQVDR